MKWKLGRRRNRGLDWNLTGGDNWKWNTNHRRTHAEAERFAKMIKNTINNNLWIKKKHKNKINKKGNKRNKIK